MENSIVRRLIENNYCIENVCQDEHTARLQGKRSQRRSTLIADPSLLRDLPLPSSGKARHLTW